MGGPVPVQVGIGVANFEGWVVFTEKSLVVDHRAATGPTADTVSALWMMRDLAVFVADDGFEVFVVHAFYEFMSF